MSGVVVDAGRSRSTYHGHDAYVHDHCLRYRQNFALFYELLNSNLFAHRRILMLLRETTSETYGPRVYSHHFNLHHFNLALLFYFAFTFYFAYLYQKYQKYYIYQISLS